MTLDSARPFFLTGLLLGACGSAPEAGSTLDGAREVPETRQAATQAPTVHRHDGGEGSIFANAYVIEGPEGVVVVDTTLTVSSARALRDRVRQIGKPLRAVLLTHGHPDHYNGAAILTEGDPSIPIVATAGVAEVVRRDDQAKEEQWRPMFGDEWPAERRFPDRIVDDGEVISFGSLRLRVHDLGPAESHHDSVWILEGPAPAAFVGDLLFHGVHSYMADGHTGAWLAQLDRLEGLLGGAGRLHPGHGEAGGLELLDAQRTYLTKYRQTVAELSEGAAELDEEAEADLTRRMVEHLGTDRLSFLIALGADPVAAELASEETDDVR